MHSVDVSICNLLTPLDLEVYLFLDKVKRYYQKYNSVACDGIMSHFYQCIKLFNNSSIDSRQFKQSAKLLFSNSSPNLYIDFLHLMRKIQKSSNCFGSEYKVLRTPRLYVSSKSNFRKDLNFLSVNDCGPSYRLLPSDYKHKLCSGRNNPKNVICKVLNDNYICFPSMTSEDTSAISLKKNFHEEQLHRLEDERYEVDMFQEINRYALKYLTDIQKKMEGMTKEEKLKFQLNDTIGSSSAILIRKAIFRIYGDATDNMIEGLKARPRMAVPLVISRMQEKAKEWSQIHSKFKLVWQDRANKHYLLSLDYQGDWLKKDAIYLKRSTFMSQIESSSRLFPSINLDMFFNEFPPNLQKFDSFCTFDPSVYIQNSHKSVYGNIVENTASLSGNGLFSYNLTLLYPTNADIFAQNHCGLLLKDVLDSANSLISNYINQQTILTKEEKLLITDYIFNIYGHFFDFPNAKIASVSMGSVRELKQRKSPLDRSKLKRPCTVDESAAENRVTKSSSPQLHPKESNENIFGNLLRYNVMFGNSYMYTFVRLYHSLIDRLTVLKIYSNKLSAADHDMDDSNEENSVDDNDRFHKVLQVIIDSSDPNLDSVLSNENTIRSLFTTKAFIWFTVPRLVAHIVKLAQQIICVGLESSKDFLDLFCLHSRSKIKGTSGFVGSRNNFKPAQYAKEAIEFSSQYGISCFFMVYIQQEGRLLVRYIDPHDGIVNNTVEPADTVETKTVKISITTDDQMKRSFNTYEKFINFPSMTTQLSISSDYKVVPTLLLRNLKKCVRLFLRTYFTSLTEKSLCHSYPSQEEIAFMKLKSVIKRIDETGEGNSSINKEKHFNALCDFINLIFPYKFSENQKKQGYFQKKRRSGTYLRKRSIENISQMLMKS